MPLHATSLALVSSNNVLNSDFKRMNNTDEESIKRNYYGLIMHVVPPLKFCASLAKRRC